MITEIEDFLSKKALAKFEEQDDLNFPLPVKKFENEFFNKIIDWCESHPVNYCYISISGLLFNVLLVVNSYDFSLFEEISQLNFELCDTIPLVTVFQITLEKEEEIREFLPRTFKAYKIWEKIIDKK